MIIQTEALVLKSFDFRETSKIVTFFTKEEGKIKGVMKGIRKDPRKFGSSADRFTLNDIVFYQYTRSDLHLISHCDLKQFYHPIREDYRKNLAANYCLELVDSIMASEEPNTDIYSLILEFLDSLAKTDDIDRLVHSFQIKMLSLSGFRPHIDSCVKTGKKITGKAKFSASMGGLVSLDYPSQDYDFMVISKGTISTIHFIENNRWDTCMKLGLTKIVKNELKFILNNFLVYHLEKRLKSSKYILAEAVV